MAVDWLRSCYSSEWRFFANAPDVVTRGRYYFVPDDTPALPYQHDFYSAVWTENDDDFHRTTGPIQDAPRTWRNGSLDFAIPPAQAVGDPLLFDGGLRYPSGTNTEPARAGILERCWTNAGVPFLDFDSVSDLNNCCLRACYLQLLELEYQANTALIDQFFAQWLGPHITPVHFPLNDLEPAMTLVVTPSYSMVICSGTDNFQQLAMQGAYGLIPPQDFGSVHTAQIWWELSQLINDRLNSEGADAEKPIILVGHSYGAAGCAALAIRLRSAKPDRQIFLMTCGMPKPSNQAGINLLATCNTLHLLNDGDPVPHVPFSPLEVAPFSFIVVPTLAAIWGDWVSASEYRIQAVDGTKRVNVLPTLGANVVLPLATRFVLGDPIGPFAAHDTVEYIRRNCIGCNCPRWPIPVPAWNILFPTGCPPAIEQAYYWGDDFYGKDFYGNDFFS